MTQSSTVVSVSMSKRRRQRLATAYITKPAHTKPAM